MDNKSTYRRRLKDGEPDAPTQAWIDCADGLRIDCELTRKDQSTWIARPPAPYRVEPGDAFRIDRLPAGGNVEFHDVHPPEEPPASQ